MDNIRNSKKDFNDYIENIENLNFNDNSFGKYYESLEFYESFLNIPSLITDKDISRIESEIIDTDEYEYLKSVTRDTGYYTNEQIKERVDEAFEELQAIVEKMVFETYQEKVEEWREVGLMVEDIDELAIAFKDGTWTFTPLHIEDDGSKSIAAHSVKIDLGWQKELELKKEFIGENPNDKKEKEAMEKLLQTCDNLVIKTKEELEPDYGLAM